MSVICPDCKTELGPDDAFCGNCGRPRPQPLEKKQTLVFRSDDGDDENEIEAVLAATSGMVAGATAPVVEPIVVSELPPIKGPVGFDALAPAPTQPPATPTPVPVPELISTYKPRPEPWLCKQCNTLNIAQDEYCNICGAMRVSPEPEPVPEPVALLAPVTETKVDILAKALAPKQEGDERLGWRYVVGQATNEGIARFGSANEDSSFRLEINRIFQSKPEPFALYIVADGMGGQDAGEVASRMVIEAVGAEVLTKLAAPWLAGQELDKTTVEDTLRQAVQEGHHRVRQANIENDRESGTTITTVCIINNLAVFANVGDSRTYLFRPWKEPKVEKAEPPASENPAKTLKLGTDARRTNKLSTNGKPNGENHAADAAKPQPRLEIQRVTRDQSLVQTLVDEGRIKPDDVYSDPRRNVVLNAIGAPDEDVPVDTYQRELEPGDTILLCSDGMWEMARDDAIAERILTLDSPQACADELVALACRNGGADNVAVLVVQVERS